LPYEKGKAKIPGGYMAKELRKSEKKMIAGVCGGVAEYFGIDPTIVRLAFVALTFAGGFMIIVYILGWIIMPSRKRDENQRHPTDATTQPPNSSGNRVMWLGIILLIVGAGFLLGNFNYFCWWNFARFWPVLLIAIGIMILFKSFSVREKSNEC